MALIKTSNPALNINSFRVEQAVSGEPMTLDNGDPDILLNSISRYYKLLPGEQQQAFLVNLREMAS